MFSKLMMGNLGLLALVAQAVEFKSVDHKGDCSPFAAQYGEDIETYTKEIVAGKEYDMQSKGAEYGFHCKGDQGRFTYVPITGDFDVSMQVAEMDNGGVMRGDIPAAAKAGLQARLDTTAGSVMVNVEVVSSPKHADSHYLAVRRAEGGSLVSNPRNFEYSYINGRQAKPDLFPRSFPNEWIRLKRVGNVFTGYLSKDGVTWHTLCNVGNCNASSPAATFTHVMPATVLVGFHGSGSAEMNAIKANFKFKGLKGFPTITPTTQVNLKRQSRLSIRASTLSNLPWVNIQGRIVESASSKSYQKMLPIN